MGLASSERGCRRFQMTAGKQAHIRLHDSALPELWCRNSVIEILAKRLPIAYGPAFIEVPPVLLGDSGLIENEVGSRTA